MIPLSLGGINFLSVLRVILCWLDLVLWGCCDICGLTVLCQSLMYEQIQMKRNHYDSMYKWWTTVGDANANTDVYTAGRPTADTINKKCKQNVKHVD